MRRVVIRRRIKLDLSPYPDGEDWDDRKTKNWRNTIRAAFRGLIDHDWGTDIYEADLDSDRLPKLLETLQQLISDRIIERLGGWLTERLVDDATTPVQSSTVAPQIESNEVSPPAGLEGLPTIKADRIPAGPNVAAIWAPVWVSERFKAFVEANCLKGLEFIWVTDIGKFRATQWYQPIALHSI